MNLGFSLVPQPQVSGNELKAIGCVRQPNKHNNVSDLPLTLCRRMLTC
jgi:hypothetical protein